MSLFGSSEPKPADQPTTFDPVKFSEGLLTIVDMMGQVAEQTKGYRATLEQMGFSPTAAEVMAIEFHKSMLRLVLPTPQ
jgi:hypothetical protein